MAATKTKVKTPIGMQYSYYYPIASEADAAHPTYKANAEVDMGAAVKGYLSVTTASAEIPGDDITQVANDKFVSGQLDVETTLSDLEVNAQLYGHKYSEEDGEVSNSADVSPNGGYGFVEPILKKDKTVVYRASFFFKVTALQSSEKQEADTKKSGELSPKMNAVSFKVMEDNTGDWRVRKDFTDGSNTTGLAAALAFIRSQANYTAAESS